MTAAAGGVTAFRHTLPESDTSDIGEPILITVEPGKEARPGPASITSLEVHATLASTLRGRAVAAVTAEEWTYCWEGLAVRNDEGVPDVEEVLGWLPEGAEVVFGNLESLGSCFLLARLPDALVEVGARGTMVTILVAARSSKLASQLGEHVAKAIPGPPPDAPNVVGLQIWNKSADGPNIVHTTVEVPTWNEVERNYPQATRSQLAQLTRHEPDATASGGRLILFHGPPGTGKTYAIRALLSEWRDWCDPVLITDPEVALHDYDYLRRLLHPIDRQLEKRWSLVIAEDADRFVRAHNRSADNSVLDRLLNATDGLLGQSSRTLFLLTTNIALATVNPALSRPGRCLATITFEPFGASEARTWLGGEGTAGPQMTLAEMYASKGTSRRPHLQVAAYGQYL